jgi:DNA-binding HxlR family transcriptional regulator
MKNKRRSPCPIACVLDLLGDKWTLLLIRDMWLGRSHFKEFLSSPEGIATNILSDRLERLVEAGLAERYASDELPGREAYRLTRKGASLKPVLQSIADWGLEHLEGTERRLKPKSS